MKRLMILVFFFFLQSVVFATEKVGAITGLPLPRFVMLKSKDVNMRSGPGTNYPLKINYKCYHLPVKVLAEIETWRLVKDSNGNEGWIHEAMLDKNKYVELVADNLKIKVFRLPDTKSKQIVEVERGVVAKLIKCRDDWCNVSIAKSYKGWVHKNNLWGVDT
jgi:SH3-like domain-containing protein